MVQQRLLPLLSALIAVLITAPAQAAPAPVPTPQLPPERLLDFSSQAKEIIRRHDILLNGGRSQFGNIAAVDPRLWIRDKNVELSKELSKKKSAAQAAPAVPVTDTNTSPWE